MSHSCRSGGTPRLTVRPFQGILGSLPVTRHVSFLRLRLQHYHKHQREHHDGFRRRNIARVRQRVPGTYSRPRVPDRRGGHRRKMASRNTRVKMRFGTRWRASSDRRSVAPKFSLQWHSHLGIYIKTYRCISLHILTYRYVSCIF